MHTEPCPQCQTPLQYRRTKRQLALICPQSDCAYEQTLKDYEVKEITQLPQPCPQCEAPLAVKSGRYGMFIGCTDYPNCGYVHSVHETATSSSSPATLDCPKCRQGQLAERVNRFGKTFYACTTYPACDNALNGSIKTGPCPTCQWPILVQKKSQWLCAKKQCQHVVGSA